MAVIENTSFNELVVDWTLFAFIAKSIKQKVYDHLQVLFIMNIETSNLTCVSS